MTRQTWSILAKGGCVLVLLLATFAVFYPVLYKGWDDRTRVHGCLLNVRLLAQGLVQYAQDYDERLPNTLEWPRVLPPYVQGQTTFHCSTDSVWVRQRENQKPFGPRSYDMLQRWSYQRWPGDGERSPRLLSFYEIGDEGVAYRHNGGMNIGFMDGHVKWVSRAKMPPHVILKGVVE